MTSRSTPFTDRSTAAEVLQGLDLTGRRIVVTGGASGIGSAVSRAFAAAGAEVTIAVRKTDLAAAADLAARAASAPGSISVAPLELTTSTRSTLSLRSGRVPWTSS